MRRILTFALLAASVLTAIETASIITAGSADAIGTRPKPTARRGR